MKPLCAKFYRTASGFSLVEVLVAISVLAVLVLMITRLFDSAANVLATSTKRLDVDAELRPVLDRMAVDIAAMVKRADVDYYLKTSGNAQVGNDQIAFFSEVTGYYPSSGSPSPLSLVAYRINATRLERLGKGLLWNGVSTSDAPIVFLPLTIPATWPAATNAGADPDYETVGARIFRFEYYYQLRDGSLSDTPWAAGQTAVNGFRDVAAIECSFAVIDPKSKVLAPEAQLSDLAGDLTDFSANMSSGGLAAAWQATLNSTTIVPRPAASAIRIAHRSFAVSAR